jgi:hypothetical protein
MCRLAEVQGSSAGFFEGHFILFYSFSLQYVLPVRAIERTAMVLKLLVVASCLALVWPGLSRTAFAGEDLDKHNKERAFHLVKAAVDLQSEGKHVMALEALTEASLLYQHPKIMFYKARSLTALSKWQVAFDVWDGLMGDEALKESQLVEVRDGWVLCKQKSKEETAPNGAPLAHQLEPAAKLDLSHDESSPTDRAEVSSDKDLHVEVAASKGNSVLSWSLIGGGAAGALGGAALLGQWAVQKSRQEAGKHLEGESTAIALGASLAGLGLGALGTGLYFLLADNDDRDATALLVPMLRSDGLGFVWQGSF